MDQKNDGALLISTSQKLSINDVRKEINFCKKTNLNIIGVVENMKNMLCNHCGELNELFGNKNSRYFEQMLKDFDLEQTGEISFSS